MTFRRAIMAAAVLCLAVPTLLWTLRPSPVIAMARWLDVGQCPQRAECAMILTGDERSRPLMAAALIKAGLARRALVAEVVDPPTLAKLGLPPSHEVDRRVLLRCGIASANITLLPAKATTTYDEAVALATFLENRPQTRVIVVTNNYHTRRSRWIFARALGEQAERVSFVSAPPDDFRTDCWWRDEVGFVTITTEYLKLAFYVVRYGYLGWWLAACGGLALVATKIRLTRLSHHGGADIPACLWNVGEQGRQECLPHRSG